uniref:Uncharacterized protein n=1 Tax=Glossina palpalis gambiensis TaxID=67801 RepID=A0A1B0BIS7_9MUSC
MCDINWPKINHENIFLSIAREANNQERSYQKDDSQDEGNVLNDIDEYNIEYGNDDDNDNDNDNDNANVNADDHRHDDDDDDDGFSINVAFFSIA